MQNIRPFQIALLALFALMGILSLVLLASFEGFVNTEEQQYGDRVVIWGPFDRGVMNDLFIDIGRENDAFSVVEYVEKDPRTFEEEFVNAVAEGRGPDVVILPHEKLVTFRTKLLPIPYETFSARDFRDRFIDGAEIFARPDGIYAIPLAVDPLVMFWNRDSFSENGFSVPPATWEAVVGSVVPSITEIGVDGSILESALAFGEYVNVTYGKEVLLTLMMQSGSRLVEETEQGYQVALNDALAQNTQPPATAAVQFYTNFSNPGRALYTWNSSMGNDRTAFLGGDLALYFAYASDIDAIRQGNPNLNFDAAPLPQGASATVERGYGTFYGAAVVRSSQNRAGAYAAIMTLTENDTVSSLSERLSFVPVVRTVLAEGTEDPYRQIAYDAALIARGWLDPDPQESDRVFEQMIDDVVSGRQRVADAVSDAVRRLELAF